MIGVLVAGGGGDAEFAGGGVVGPAGILFGVVAAHAESGGVVPGGGPAFAVGCGVVDVPDRGIAVRGTADPVTQEHHAPQQAGEGTAV